MAWATSGGVGSAAIQLGVAAGARVFATAGGPEKLRFCSDLGADVAIDSRSDDFVERIFELTDDRGVDVVCDLVGGATTERSWSCTAREGRYLVVGFAEDPENGLSGHALRPLTAGNFAVVGVMLAWVTNLPPFVRKLGINPFPRAVAEDVHAQLGALLAAKKIRPTLQRRVGLEAAAAALEDHEARRTIGRTVVELNGG